MKGGMEKHWLWVISLTQKPGNGTGRGRGERGQQEWFFLGFGFWVLGFGGKDNTEKNPLGRLGSETSREGTGGWPEWP